MTSIYTLYYRYICNVDKSHNKKRFFHVQGNTWAPVRPIKTGVHSSGERLRPTSLEQWCDWGSERSHRRTLTLLISDRQPTAERDKSPRRERATQAADCLQLCVILWRSAAGIRRPTHIHVQYLIRSDARQSEGVRVGHSRRGGRGERADVWVQYS